MRDLADGGGSAVVLEQEFRRRRLVTEAHDDDVHMRLVGGLVAPDEAAVREGDVDAVVKQRLPDRGDLLPLTYRVRGDEGGMDCRPAHVLRRLDVPAGHVVHRLDLAEEPSAIGILLWREIRVADERWFAGSSRTRV